jgi:hypothetical protein
MMNRIRYGTVTEVDIANFDVFIEPEDGRTPVLLHLYKVVNDWRIC